ncbi:MAG: nucleotidyltransferase domain-containing protein [Fibrobacteres bacterium]|nr:nucleotidyltransferase domain-containing protein [Fibrobacterota bacterium]
MKQIDKIDGSFVEQAHEVIVDVFETHGVFVDRVILFGSRARGDAKTDSDWDFCVVINKLITFPEKNKIINLIHKKLAHMHQPMDIVIKTLEQMENEVHDWGYLTPTILEEGVLV